MSLGEQSSLWTSKLGMAPGGTGAAPVGSAEASGVFREARGDKRVGLGLHSQQKDLSVPRQALPLVLITLAKGSTLITLKNITY